MSDRIVKGDTVIVTFDHGSVKATFIRGPDGSGDTFGFVDANGVPFEVNGNASAFQSIWRTTDTEADDTVTVERVDEAWEAVSNGEYYANLVSGEVEMPWVEVLRGLLLDLRHELEADDE